MPRTELSLAEARRLALAAHGFDRPRPPRPDTAHIRRVIRRLGLLQLDFVNVLVPAHYQVLFSRLGPYPRSLYDRVVRGGGTFVEQWAHEASLLPVESWPLLDHRRRAYQPLPRMARHLRAHPDYVSGVLDQVRKHGPLSQADLPLPEGAEGIRSGRGNLAGEALGWHFGRGDVVVTERRPNFARMYDIAERVIPAEQRHRVLSVRDAQRALILLAARAHGIATADDLADYYRMPTREARPAIADLLANGALHEARVEGLGEPAYLHPRARLPRRMQVCSLLSPFDPVIWRRPRDAWLFDFDYRLEIFVAKAKRRWGYYVLPFLLRDRLVARVDLKSDRAGRRLRVLAAYVEDGADRDEVAPALATELRQMAGWLGLTDLSVARKGPFAQISHAQQPASCTDDTPARHLIAKGPPTRLGRLRSAHDRPVPSPSAAAAGSV